MRICVYEDAAVANLEPLALTRPAFDLRCGAFSLLERQVRYWNAGEVGAIVRPELAEFCAVLHPTLTVNNRSWLQSGPVVLVNARWLPPPGPASAPRNAQVGVAGNQVAFVAVPWEGLAEATLAALAAYVAECQQTLPSVEAGGRMIDYPWDLVESNGEALEQDYQLRKGRGVPAPHVTVVGPRERLIVEAGARVDPLVVIDTTKGPVLIDRGAVVQAFSLIEGPSWVGPDTHVLSARVRGSSLGPVCRVGGEVEATILHGYSNKAHDGFLGHSYLGEWINFGAGTQVSDLRNDYGPVTVAIAGQKVNTGLTKVGSFVGDHTKTGLNTIFNTGTAVGPFCNLLASDTFLPKTVPAFCSFAHGRLQDRADFRQLFTTAATVMRRRNREWTGGHADFFLALYGSTADYRRQVLRESEQRRLRRTM
jgi:UDP-N-acetylglucosamine diphosphorylase/glucosamine-1-phosphate N-acetyltransferase